MRDTGAWVLSALALMALIGLGCSDTGDDDDATDDDADPEDLEFLDKTGFSLGSNQYPAASTWPSTRTGNGSTSPIIAL